MTGEPTPVKALLPRELLASVIPPAAVPRQCLTARLPVQQEKGSGHMTEAAALHTGALSPIMQVKMTFAALIRQEGLYNSRPKHCKDAQLQLDPKCIA